MLWLVVGILGFPWEHFITGSQMAETAMADGDVDDVFSHQGPFY